MESYIILKNKKKVAFANMKKNETINHFISLSEQADKLGFGFIVVIGFSGSFDEPSYNYYFRNLETRQTTDVFYVKRCTSGALRINCKPIL